MTDRPSQGRDGDGVPADMDLSQPEASLGEQATAGESGSSVENKASPLEADAHSPVFEQVVDLAARYRIQGTLGEGGMGQVLRAVEIRLGRPVAIKRLQSNLAESQGALRRFLTEAQSVAVLSHPNITQVFDYGRDADGPFIVMELIDGESLAERLRRGPLEPQAAVDLICQVCDGLEFAHARGIIHRDIKPGNILIGQDAVPRLADFGLARQEFGDEGQTQVGTVLGTLDFMSPEQRVDATQADVRSDLWSMAATLYQMVTGDPPRVIALDQVPEFLREVLSQALKTNPDKRYQTAGSFRRALHSALESIAATAGVVESAGIREVACPSCGEPNPEDRGFCGHCGAKIASHCPACDTAVSSFEKFCGHCGVNLDDAIQTKRAEYTALQQDVERFREQQRHREAVDLLTQLADAQHPALSEFARWAANQRPVLESEWTELEAERDRLVNAARAHVDNSEFENAAAVLDEIPEPLHSPTVVELRRRVDSRHKMLANLRQEIDSALASKQYAGLLENIDRCLETDPDDDRLKQLRTEAHEREIERSAALKQATEHFNSYRDEPCIDAVLELPEALRYGEIATLLEQARRRTREAERLRARITSLVEQRHFGGVHEAFADYSAIRPDDIEIIELLEGVRGDLKLRERLPIEARIRLGKYDYEGAIALLEEIPEPMRDTPIVNLLEETREKQQRCSALLDEIRGTAAAGQEESLHELIEKYLVLNPGDPDVISLRDRLLQRAEGHKTRELADQIVAAVKAGELDGLMPRIEEYLLLEPEDKRINQLADKLRKKELQDQEQKQQQQRNRRNRLKRKMWTLMVLLISTVVVVAPASYIAIRYVFGTPQSPGDITPADDVKPAAGPTDSGQETDRVTCLAFAPGGRQFVSGSGRTLRIRETDGASKTITLDGHLGLVTCVAYSPDGELIASGGHDKTIRIWRASTGNELLAVDGHADTVWSVVFSSDGTRLASASSDKTVRVWNARTGLEVLVLEGHSDWVQNAVFSPDGKRLASASNDKTVRVWDAASGNELLELKGHTGWIQDVAFNPSGTRLASASSDMTVRVWNAETGLELLTLHGHSGWARRVIYSPDGKWLTSTSSDLSVKVWNATTGRNIRTLKDHTAPVLSVFYNNDGRQLTSIDETGTVKSWDLEAEQPAEPPDDRSAREPVQPDSPQPAGRQSQTITVTRKDTLRGHLSSVNGVAFSPDGRMLASAGADETVRLWRVATGGHLFTLRGHSDSVTSVAFGPVDRLVTGSQDRTVKLWDLKARRELRTLQKHASKVTRVAFNRKRNLVASSGADHRVRLVNLTSGKALQSLPGHRSVKFGPDGRFVAVADGNEAKIWRIGARSPRLTLAGHSDVVHDVAISSDGRRVALVSEDNLAKLWDIETGELLLSLDGHQSGIWAVAFSPDGRWLATVTGGDNRLRLWDTTTGRNVVSLGGHSNDVRCVAFSPDGKHLATGSEDRTIALWQIKPVSADRGSIRNNRSTTGSKKRSRTTKARF